MAEGQKAEELQLLGKGTDEAARAEHPPLRSARRKREESEKSMTAGRDVEMIPTPMREPSMTGFSSHSPIANIGMYAGRGLLKATPQDPKERTGGERAQQLTPSSAPRSHGAGKEEVQPLLPLQPDGKIAQTAPAAPQQQAACPQKHGQYTKTQGPMCRRSAGTVIECDDTQEQEGQ